MTCIVGIVSEGKVFMGGDSYIGCDYSSSVLEDPKIFKKDNMIFGVTGTLRGLQLMKYKNWIPKYREDEYSSEMEYICSDFIDALKKLFKDNGYSYLEDNQDKQQDWYLLGWGGKLYTIQCNFQVVTLQRKYHSIGVAADVALGCLYSNEKFLSDDSVGYITMALKAAQEFSCGVRGPFIIESI